MQAYHPPRLTFPRQIVTEIDQNCHFLGKVVFLPFKANSLIVITVAECARDVLIKGTSFLNAISLSDKKIKPLSIYEKELEEETEADVEEPVELSLANLNFDVLHYLISNFFEYEDILSISSLSKEFYEQFRDIAYKTNPNHHLYQKIENSQYLNKISRKITSYKIAFHISPLLNGVGTHLSLLGSDIFGFYVGTIGFYLPVFHFLYSIDQIVKMDILSYPSRDSEKEALKQILSYPSCLKDDFILQNYLIDGKVPLMPCIDAYGRSFDYANVIINKQQSTTNKRGFVFDFDSFKIIQNRLYALKNKEDIPRNILTFDSNSS